MKLFLRAGIPPLKRMPPCREPYKNHRWHMVVGHDVAEGKNIACTVSGRACLRCKLIVIEHILEAKS